MLSCCSENDYKDQLHFFCRDMHEFQKVLNYNWKLSREAYSTKDFLCIEWFSYRSAYKESAMNKNVRKVSWFLDGFLSNLRIIVL